MRCVMGKPILLLLLLICMALVAFAADTPIVIGVPLPLSGKQMPDGRMMQDAFEMAKTTINAQGGINGRLLNLVYADDEGQAETGEKIVGELVRNAKVTMLVGGHTSGPTYAMAKTANRLGVPFLISTASADKITQKRWKNIYRLNPPVSEYTKGLEDFWVKNRKPQSLSIIYEESMFGINGATYMMGFCQENGIDIHTTIAYDKNRKEPAYFRSILASQKAEPPDIIYMVSRLEDGVALVKTIRELGIDVLLCGGAGGFTNPEFITRAGEAAEGLVTATLWTHQVPYPGARAYYDQFIKRYHYAPDYHGVEAYAALHVVADVLKRAASLKPEDIRSALDNTFLMTPFGPVKFYNYDDFERQNTVRTLVLQVTNDRFEVIWPPDMATAQFVPPDKN